MKYFSSCPKTFEAKNNNITGFLSRKPWWGEWRTIVTYIMCMVQR